MRAAYAKRIRLTSGSSDPELHHYTFRIQSIDESISEEQLKTWLTQLSPSNDNVLALSLAPHNGHQTATVTFRHVPSEFESMSSGKQNSENFIAKIGTLGTDVTVDTDFLGITPLYSGTDPSIE
jgi:hypothetical protein